MIESILACKIYNLSTVKGQPDNTQVILTFDVCVGTFLGLIHFYTKFSKNHADKIVPLLGLLEKGIKWYSNDDLEQAFNVIKLLFSSSVLLNYPGIYKPFNLQTDASEMALCAILFELDKDRSSRPIIHAVCQASSPVHFGRSTRRTSSMDGHLPNV